LAITSNDTIFSCRVYVANRVLTKRQAGNEAVKDQLQEEVMLLRRELAEKKALVTLLKNNA
jgi:hypothetical protein